MTGMAGSRKVAKSIDFMWRSRVNNLGKER